MFLDSEEERILEGYEGEAKARALKVIVKVGESLGASRLIKIKHAHISGVSYENIGDSGLEFINNFRLLGAKFSVPTTINPISYDLLDYNSIYGLKLSREYIRAQELILRALEDMGAELILTCTPYYTRIPERYNLKVGDHVAWGESSAVAYANSILGIRSNREGGPLALMAAIAGRTYYYGMHIDEERIPRVEYIVESIMLDEAEAGVLGEIIAGIHRDSRPPMVNALFKNNPSIKEFLAAISTAGDLAMAHIRGITPEDPRGEISERVNITIRDIERLLEERSPIGDVDIVYIGCPHASLDEFKTFIRMLEEKHSRGKARIIVSMSRSVFMEALSIGLVERAQNIGVSIVRDSCLIVSPFSRFNRDVSVVTNSYKAYYYLSRRGVKTYLARTRDLVKYI
ncbi:MAG: aconitase X catalytic domain-containing protein [Acidilobaceae archaeon]